jgi:hypothetical protein
VAIRSATPMIRLLRILCLALVCAMTAELFVRVEERLTWGAPLVGTYNHDQLLLQDSLGGRGRPGYRFEKWRMNNEGLRGADISHTPAPGVVRIAVMGASESFGLYETEGREYPARMQALLDSIAPGRFEVINAALPGMSLSTMVPYFRHVVAPLRPSMVLIYPSPSFYLEVEPVPVMYTPPGAVTHRPAGEGSIRFESRLAAKGRDVLKELVPPGLVAAYREWRLGQMRARHGPEWVWSTVPEDRMDILRQQLAQLIPTIQASGVRPVLVTHTNRFIGLSPEQARQERRHLVNLISTYYPRASEAVMIAVDSAANSVIRGSASRYGADVVEAEGRIRPGGENFADYAHFTDSGADAMARLLATAALALEKACGALPATTPCRASVESP